MHQARGLAFDGWLAGESALRGVRENAAVLAVLEVPERRAETAQIYRRQHPGRSDALNDLLAVVRRHLNVSSDASWNCQCGRRRRKGMPR